MLKCLPKQWKELFENLINRLESIKGVQCFVDSFVKKKAAMLWIRMARGSDFNNDKLWGI